MFHPITSNLGNGTTTLHGSFSNLLSISLLYFIGNIPLDPEVRVGGDTGNPIVISQPESQAAISLLDIADAIARISTTQAEAQQSNSIPIEIVE